MITGSQNLKPRAFLELPAGLASVSLRLQGGAHCRPPISRMGNKAGYSQTILGVLGLHSGQGAGAYWWAEADPDVAALLRIYPDPDALREVARIIRGWAGEEPRALWERLRAERRARGAAAGTAEWCVLRAWSVKSDESFYRGPNNTSGGVHDRGALTISGLADRADRLAEVAGWVVAGEWAFRQGAPESGFNPTTALGSVWASDSGRDGFRPPTTCEKMADRLASSAISAPVRVSPRIPSAAEVSAAIGTPGDLSGCVVYMDPPYAGTTGYTADLSRAEVVAHALDFASLGATVAISEAEAIPDLVRSGWYSVEITGGRVGAKRTFSKQQQEIITMNKQPQYTVPTQSSLFG